QLRPPYRMATFDWFRYILGGTMFGIGMTLASGCANKTLVRIGGGNIKSVVVLIIASYFAYLMQFTAFYENVFYYWINPMAIDLTLQDLPHQDMGSIVSATTGIASAIELRLIIGLMIATGLLIYIFKSKDFRGNFDHILGGLVVGLVIVGAWYVTGGPMGMEWLEEVEMMDEPPFGVGVQAFSFTNPMADAANLVANMGQMKFVTFGFMALAGVIVGSFLYSLLFRKFRLEWFNSFGDFVNHAIGAALMGIGGILALGCTIGQGITGVSTLAVGSFMAFFSLIFGSALTMKIQYYKMVYEKDATFVRASITALVDMRLLPGGMRMLDAV
ncbi:MAG: YeeE/YedE family protein, partial [Thiohalomonadales bacterium]